jgi:hypothetical protein
MTVMCKNRLRKHLKTFDFSIKLESAKFGDFSPALLLLLYCTVLYCAVLYSKPSGRILKLYYYSVVGKFLRDFFTVVYEMLIIIELRFLFVLAGSDQNSAQIASGMK